MISIYFGGAHGDQVKAKGAEDRKREFPDLPARRNERRRDPDSEGDEDARDGYKRRGLFRPFCLLIFWAALSFCA